MSTNRGPDILLKRDDGSSILIQAKAMSTNLGYDTYLLERDDGSSIVVQAKELWALCGNKFDAPPLHYKFVDAQPGRVTRVFISTPPASSNANSAATRQTSDRTDAWVVRLANVVSTQNREALVGDLLADRARLRSLNVPEKDINWHTGSDLISLAVYRIGGWAWSVLKWAGILATAEFVKEAARAFWKHAS